ncbi:MAG: hypothetical protein PHW93_05700 [Candidatus Methanomethylophilaceae archaeon]|nr:hypothetical protein [Candidatus Methanomethylophilaceae archaeon]
MKLPFSWDDFDAEVVRNRFLVGFAVTFFVVLIVPIIADYLLQPLLQSVFGEGSPLAVFSSSLVVTILLWVIVLLLKMVGSGSKVFQFLGLPGVIGLLVAYWVMGNLWGAIMPLVSIVMAYAWKNRGLYLDGFRD